MTSHLAFENTRVGSPRRVRAHRSFAVVLSGGGAAGLSHAGVLRGLEHAGYVPDAVVGVSMGAIVGATYVLSPDWYSSLRDLRLGRFNIPMKLATNVPSSWIRALFTMRSLVGDMFFGWGVGARAVPMERRVLRALVREQRLEEGRIPIAIVATDLLSRRRIVLREGPAAEAMYASAALAGIFPPLPWNGHLLVDGAYVDPIPVDVARDLGARVVIVVEPQSRSSSENLKNGIEAMIRAMEICSMEHAAMRRREADLVVRPVIHEGPEMLDFKQSRACIAAGLRAVRASAHELQRVLAP